MDRTHRGSADRSGMPKHLPGPCCGGSQHSLPAVSRWCSECTRDAGVLSIRRASRLPTPLSQEMPKVAAQDFLLHRHSTTIPVVPTRGARPSLHFTGSRSTVQPCTWLQFSTTLGSRARARRRLHGSQRRVGTRVHRQPPRACRYPRAVADAIADAPHPRRWPRIRCRGLPPICRRSRRCVRPTQQRDTRCSPPERHSGSTRDWASSGVRRLLRAEAKQVPRGRAWYLHRFAMSDLKHFGSRPSVVDVTATGKGCGLAVRSLS